MAGYSAGTLFLQVVPVFKDMQRTIAREAKDINRALGDEMEVGGRDAGRRASKAMSDEFGKGTKEGARRASDQFRDELQKSLRDIDRDLKPIRPRLETGEVNQQVGDLRRELAALRKDSEKGIDPRRYQEFSDRLERARTHAAGLRDEFSDLQKADFSKASRGLDNVAKRMQAVRRAAEIDVRFQMPERELAVFERRARDTARRISASFRGIEGPDVDGIRRRLDELADVRIGVDMSTAEFDAEIRQVEERLRRLATESADIEVTTSVAGALGDLALLHTAAEALDGKNVNIDADVRTAGAVAKLGALGAASRGAASGAGTAMVAFRSFNPIILLLAVAIPPLIPLIGALGGGLLALVPILGAVGAGMGAMFVGFTGLGDAVKAIEEFDELQRSGTATAEQLAKANEKVEESLRKLSPAGRSFATYLVTLKEGFVNLRKSIQEAMLPGVMQGMRKVFAFYGSSFTAFLTEMGAGVGALSVALGQSLTGPIWSKFFGQMKRLSPIMAANFGQAMINYLEAFAAILSASVPSAEALSRAMVRSSASFRDWAASARGQNSVQAFLGYAAEVAPHVGRTFEALGRAVVNLAKALAPWGMMMLDVFTAVFDLIARIPTRLLGVLAGTIISLAMGFQFLAGYLALSGAMAKILGGTLGRVFFASFGLVGLVAALALQYEGLRNVLKAVGGFLWEHRGLLMGVATVVLGAIAIWKTYLAIMWGARAAMAAYAVVLGVVNGVMFLHTAALAAGRSGWIAYTVAQWAANIAAYAFPLTWIVLALVAVGVALFVAWKKSETFRRVVLRAWDGVKKGARLLWVAVKFYFGLVRAYWTTVFRGMRAVWNRVLRPTFPAIRAAARGMFTFVRLYLRLLRAYWTTVFRGMRAVWNRVLRPTFPAIRGAARRLWVAIKLYFGLVRAYWGLVFRAMRTIWQRVLRPTFSAIGRAIGGLYRLFRANLRRMRAVFDLVFTAMRTIWRRVLRPTLSAVGSRIRSLADKIFAPAARRIRDRWNDLKGPFRAVRDVFAAVARAIGDRLTGKNGLTTRFRIAVGAIRRLWDSLKGAFKAPVKFLVNTVINKGVIGGFNKVARFVGSEEMEPVKLPKGFATGGILPGYTPGRDVHHFASPTGGRLSLSGGEAIMRPEWTAAMGPDYIHRMNAAARAGGASAIRKMMGGQAFAKGGVWHPGRRSQRANHGKSLSQAWDINSPGGTGTPVKAFLDGIITAVANLGNTSYGRYIKMNHPGAGLQSLYAHLSAQLVRPGQRVKRGQVIGREGNTGGSTGPHLHFELGGGASAIQAAGAGSSGGGVGLPGWITGLLTGGPVKWLMSKAKSGLDNFTEKFGDNLWGKSLSKIPRKIAGVLKDKLGAMVDKINPVDDIKGVVGKITDGFKSQFSTAGNAAIRAQVMSVAKQHGWHKGAQWQALAEIIGRESGWNPNAANPNSSARGLFQKMTSVNGPVEDTVAGQARWGLNYIRSRYGDPKKALAFHNRHNWYADGGIYDPSGVAPSAGANTAAPGAALPYNGTMQYDRGGYLPPGLTTVVNLTGKPEPVFTQDQFRNMGGRSAAGGGLTYAPTINGTNLSAEDLIDDLEFTYRKLSRTGGGRYGL